MSERNNSPFLHSYLSAAILVGCSGLISGCKPGSEITEYQAPTQILRAFRVDHPAAQSPTYRQMTRDGVKVFMVEYFEGDEEREAWYNVQGKPFVSKAERRSVEQERQKQIEEQEAKAREEAEEKAEQAAEKGTVQPAAKPNPKPTSPSGGHLSVP